MSKYVQFLLVMSYAFLLIGCGFIIVDVFGWLHKPLRDSFVFGSILGWLLFCFSAPWWLSDFFLLFKNVRKPILEEEQRILFCFRSVRQNAGHQNAGEDTRYQIRIEEEKNVNAFAMGYRTIAISRGLLAGLSDEELSAVMAHELGHLTSRDGVAAMAFFLTGCIPAYVSRISFQLLRLFLKIVRFTEAIAGIVGLVVLVLLLYYFHFAKYAGAIVVYWFLINWLNKGFQFLWLFNSRYTEYRQDAFAQRLGFGGGLRTALIKMNDPIPQKVKFFSILQSSHPFLHNRIRRLEKMEGMRD